MVITTVLTVILWRTLYHLTDFTTVANYILSGVVVCTLNTLLYDFSKRKLEKLFWVKASWVVAAGSVLVLYHAGFSAAAVLLAGAFFASPFFGATIYEGIVGFSLLIILAWLIQ